MEEHNYSQPRSLDVAVRILYGAPQWLSSRVENLHRCSRRKRNHLWQAVIYDYQCFTLDCRDTSYGMYITMEIICFIINTTERHICTNLQHLLCQMFFFFSPFSTHKKIARLFQWLHCISLNNSAPTAVGVPDGINLEGV